MACSCHGGTASDAVLFLVGDLNKGASLLVPMTGKSESKYNFSLLLFRVDKYVLGILF